MSETETISAIFVTDAQSTKEKPLIDKIIAEIMQTFVAHGCTVNSALYVLTSIEKALQEFMGKTPIADGTVQFLPLVSWDRYQEGYCKFHINRQSNVTSKEFCNRCDQRDLCEEQPPSQNRCQATVEKNAVPPPKPDCTE